MDGDRRGNVGQIGLAGDQGLVAEAIALTAEEQAAQTALNQAAVAVVAARNALADAEKKFTVASANADAVAAAVVAARAAQLAGDRATASSAAAKAAAAQADAATLAARAASDQAAADDAKKTLAQTAAAAGLHTINGAPI
jgi:mannose/fructose/N-acetylgalactosamine-specific phosphotransferase system component IIB